ncbi:hypothetical protein Goarm_011290 [Gossypium armourianum]|uniref:Uncharacterized protein n=1 Tax=Gossypium armourianum TaxID=34283 RepID=A0A7J9IWC5_9ROSI|nr:hypothetical protein [Gossypium armourianum]
MNGKFFTTCSEEQRIATLVGTSIFRGCY